MPRKGERRTLYPEGESARVGFTVESAAAGATVDVLDTDLNTNFGTGASAMYTINEFVDDFRLTRVPIAVGGDEAAATIGLALVARNGGNTGFTITFSAAAAATKKVGVRVTQL